jgi:uncharacterized membrane protein (UPF0127 family)
MSRISRALSVAVVAVVLVAAAYAVYSLSAVPGPVTSNVPTGFTVNGRSYTFTYVATTEPERESGLMNKKITDTTTELFAFPYSSAWQFYMYDTNASLDMIWVSATGSAGTVVYLVAGAQPCYDLGTCPRYTPTAQANFVIEAKAGFAAANDITNGTQLTFS